MQARSRRFSFLAGALLAMSLVGAPAVMAAEPSADDPVASVNAFLDTVVAKDFAGLPALTCAARRDETAQRFDLTQAFAGMPPTVDVATFIAGLAIGVEGRSVTLNSSDGATALVDVVGTMTMAVDEAAARTFISQVLEAQGQEVTDAIIDMVMPELMTQFEEGQDLTEQVDVVFEDGAWLVCEPFDEDDASPSPAASGAPMEPASSPVASPAM